MCGIAGKFSLDARGQVDPALIRRMTGVIAHRGPDDEGVWTEGPIGLGNRRLAVIDLSSSGHQPMSNEDGSLWIVFNGEIYNFQSLRRDLIARGHQFRSRTDTETILHLFEEYGTGAFSRLRGMFALAIWERNARRLILARDRLGKKPIFYRHSPHAFWFGSEPKTLLQDPEIEAVPDYEALHHYLWYGYVPAPWSAFEGIRKLSPGHWLEIRQDGYLRTERYWRLRYSPKPARTEGGALEELDTVLSESTRLRLIADVPVGVLLSGGIDSSAVVAMMRKVNTGRIRTFSIGFEQAEYDELAHARVVAQRFETDHHELVVKPDAVGVIPRLAWHYNEPFADSSAVPSFAVCELARRHVTVALNGDGGDESFAGYDRYLAAAHVAKIARLPRALRQIAARTSRFLPNGRPKSRVHRLRRLLESLGADPAAQYGGWMTIFSHSKKNEMYSDDFRRRMDANDSFSLLKDALESCDGEDFAERAVGADVVTYLPGDLLVKMDIASMAASLEVRSPFLDHELMEFSASLPMSLKLRGLTQKYILKRLLAPVLPASILQRPKMGFGVPIDSWFRRELREMSYDLLLDSRAQSRGLFRPEVIRRYLDEHVQGRAHHHHRLWALLMLEVWHRLFIDQRCPAAPQDLGDTLAAPLATAG